MPIPTYITHYFLKDKEPFLSLSALMNGKDDPIFKDLLGRHKKEPGYRRQYGAKYIDNRIRTESILRKKFIERGGKPIDPFPTYFVLGESKWFKNLNHDHSEIKIELDRLDSEIVSITYPDSFISFNSPTKEYHNQVYLKSEITALIEKYGFPIDENKANYEHYWLDEDGFEKYIEVQVWDIKKIKSLVKL